MHEQLFSQAAKPSASVALFLPLKPYSIGHEIELWRQNNPILTRTLAEFRELPLEEQLNWLIKAVDYCSQDHSEWIENEAILRSKPSFWARKERKKKAKLEKTWRIWDAIIRRCNISDEVIKFREYLISQRIFPPTPEDRIYNLAQGREDEPSGRGMGSPLTARLINFLSNKPSLLAGYKSIYDFPFSYAVWLYFTDAEIAGMSAIENEAERAIVDKEKQLLAEIEAEQAAEKAKEKTPCQS